MNKTAIIIPSRLEAVRLPNKPLKLINNKEMILHVYEAAKKINSEVYVATPDQKIIDVINRNNEYIGSVKLVDLFNEDTEISIEQIMDSEVNPIGASSSADEVISTFIVGWDKF